MSYFISSYYLLETISTSCNLTISIPISRLARLLNPTIERDDSWSYGHLTICNFNESLYDDIQRSRDQTKAEEWWYNIQRISIEYKLHNHSGYEYHRLLPAGIIHLLSSMPLTLNTLSSCPLFFSYSCSVTICCLKDTDFHKCTRKKEVR